MAGEKLLHEGTYLRKHILGQGTYATVYLGVKVATEETVAIKKIRVNTHSSENGLDISAIRELNALIRPEMKHINVIEVLSSHHYEGDP